MSASHYYDLPPYGAQHPARTRRRTRSTPVALTLAFVVAAGLVGLVGGGALANGGTQLLNGGLPSFGNVGLPGLGATAVGDADADESRGLVEISVATGGGMGAGTGMVVSADGIVLTNHHVIEGASDARVTVVNTGETYSARLLGAEPAADVAVLQLVGAEDLETVTLSDEAAEVGDDVTVVGDAGGDGGSLTASTGTVRALGQDITVQGTDGSGNRLTGLVELAARVVPGDSGGAVIDVDGNVVGMTVAASADAEDARGYAIPVTTVVEVANDLLAGTQDQGTDDFPDADPYGLHDPYPYSPYGGYGYGFGY